MIIPSIDLRDGNAVQLMGGREQALDAGDPRPVAERFALAGEIMDRIEFYRGFRLPSPGAELDREHRRRLENGQRHSATV